MAQHAATSANEEQILYAGILEKGMYFGLLLLLITFALYVTGILPAVVPLSEISQYWNQPVDKYLEAINHNFLHWQHPPTGWSWLKLIGRGDFINFIGVVVLSGITILCYLAIVPGFFRKKDKAYAIMAIAEALILSLAASGLLATGGH